MSDDDRLADELASLRLQRDDPPPRRDRAGSGRRSAVPGWAIGLVIAAALAIGGFFVFREGHGRMFPEEVELGAVSLMSPALSDITLVATGYVQARQKATVAPKVIGRVAKLHVDEGDEVKAGQLVAELESADAQAQLAQVRADVQAARAKVERARADVADVQAKLAREEALSKSGAGTQSALDDARARANTMRAMLTAAEADVRAVEARLQAAQVALENTKVRSPFDGTVVRKLSEIGEVVGATAATTGAVGVVTIASLGNLEVHADVSESQIGKVKAGTPAEILLDAFPDRRFRAEVSEIRQTVDRAKASVTVKVRFLDDTAGVIPDMAAKVSFLQKALDAEALKAAPKVVVPGDAVVARSGRKVVFVVEENRAREVAVTVGPAAGAVVELVSGPSPGTRVIRRPSDQVRAGTAIKEKKP